MDSATDSSVDIAGTHVRHVPHNPTVHEALTNTTPMAVSVDPRTTPHTEVVAEDVVVVTGDAGADVGENQHLQRTTNVRGIAPSPSRFALML